LMLALSATTTLSAQYHITYSEPTYSGIPYIGYMTPGPLTGAQSAGCTGNVFAYNLGTYAQLGWSCHLGEVTAFLNEWTAFYQVAVFAKFSATRYYPAAYWDFYNSYMYCNGSFYFSLVYLNQHIWPESC